MIKTCYITRINNGRDGKKYGFAVTSDNESVYIPGGVIEDWCVERDEVGTSVECALLATPDKAADYLVTTFLCDDNAIVEANRRMARRIKELESMLGEAQ